MVLLTEIANVNVFQVIIEFSVLVITVIGFFIAINKASKDKFEAKADVTRVLKIESDMECIEKAKADTDYVKELNRAVHHRIDESNDNMKGLLTQIQAKQETMNSNIFEILKMMKNT